MCVICSQSNNQNDLQSITYELEPCGEDRLWTSVLLAFLAQTFCLVVLGISMCLYKYMNMGEAYAEDLQTKRLCRKASSKQDINLKIYM